MKLLSAEQKRWLLKKSQKEILRRTKRKKRHSKGIHRNAYMNKTSFSPTKGKTHTAVAPKKFSVQDNPEETISYFATVHSLIARCQPRDELYFDFANVEVISADAIMYIIAVLNNDKKLNTFGIKCAGNLPCTESACRVLDECGFYQYVSSRRFKSKSTTTDRIKIHRGQRQENEFAQEVCEFVWAKSQGVLDRLRTKRLFAIIVEMMNNAHQHAYDTTSNPQMYGNWYSYAEDLKETVQFIFFDTGLGIPNTIRKTFLEKTIGIIWDQDSKYVVSALRGENRTQTGEDFRGKGLPEILESVTEGVIHSMQIVSGKAVCYIESTGNIIERSLNDDFKGTMFICQISKEDGIC